MIISLKPKKCAKAIRERKPLQNVEDESGVVYTAQGQTLYAAMKDLSGQYKVKEGTQRIRCKAFAELKGLTESFCQNL